MTDLTLLTTADEEWNGWLEAVPHDFYHTAGYHELARECGEGRPYLAVVGTRDRFVAWPYLLRPVNVLEGFERSALADIGSVYGYPGPLICNCERDVAFLSSAWDALTSTWRAQQAVTAFTRFHPLLENHTWLEECAGSAVGPHAGALGATAVGQTVSVDLTRTEDENLRDYRKVLRQEVAAGRRAGLETVEDMGWQHIPEFVELYGQTMSRNRAAAHYYFTREYVEQLRAALSPYIHLLVTSFEGRIAAAGIFVEYRGIVQAHLAGSCGELRALSPLKVLLDDVRRWAKARGNTVLHLGGGRAGRDDSLLAFKGRFSRLRHRFYIGRWVLDPVAYDMLCRQACVQAGDPDVTGPVDEYFPPYRAPARRAAAVCGAHHSNPSA